MKINNISIAAAAVAVASSPLLLLSGGAHAEETEGAAAAPTGSEKMQLQFYFPLAPGLSDLEAVIVSMVDEFNMSNNGNIEVTPVFAGSYTETAAKVHEQWVAGTPPEVAVLNVNAMVHLRDAGEIISLNDYVEASGGDAFLADYLGTIMEGNEVMDGNLYGMPMMRSTPVLYVNKDMLNAAGVATPTTWDELVQAAAALTNDTVKGLALPDTWDDWIFGAWSRQS